LRWFDDYQALEHQLIDVVSDSDLAHLIAGSPTLGELCWEHGEVERAYLDSFRTYKLRFDYGHPDAHLAGSTEALGDWYTRLDQEFEAVLASFVDDPETTIIDRGPGRCRSARISPYTRRRWSSLPPRLGFIYWQWARPCPSSGRIGSRGRGPRT
jgi:hypothetical protein